MYNYVYLQNRVRLRSVRLKEMAMQNHAQMNVIHGLEFHVSVIVVPGSDQPRQHRPVQMHHIRVDR